MATISDCQGRPLSSQGSQDTLHTGGIKIPHGIIGTRRGVRCRDEVRELQERIVEGWFHLKDIQGRSSDVTRGEGSMQGTAIDDPAT